MLLNDLAAHVLGRELELTPCELEAILQRALQHYAAEEPVRLRVHPEDAAGLQCTVPVVPDETLARGDALLELRTGEIDASLGARLARVLRDLQQ